MRDKYLLYLTGVLILAILLSGFKAFNNRSEKDIQVANKLFQEGRYVEAGELYKNQLLKNPEDERLNHNLATLQYITGNYQEALEYFQKGPESPEKYLLMGNICYEKGQEELNAAGKINFYQEALQYYKEGMSRFPRKIELKYNYEYVKEKLEKLQEEMGERREESNTEEDSSGTEDGEQQDKHSDQEDPSQEKEEDNKTGEEEKNTGEGEQEQEESTQDSEDEEQTGKKGEKQEEDNSRRESQDEKQEDKHNDQQAVESLAEMEGNERGREQSREEIMQILKMLEMEEEESLKNNQSLYTGSGKEDKYDW